MADQFVHFLERAFIEQQVDTLANRQLAFPMLPLFSLRPAPRFSDSMPSPHFLKPVGSHKVNVLDLVGRPSRAAAGLLAGSVADYP